MKNKYLLFLVLSFQIIIASAATSKVELSEINYHSDSSTSTGNWFEIHNISGNTLSLKGWAAADQSGTQFFFPTGLSIPKDGYLVVSDDTVKFHTRFPTVKNVVGDFTFGLSNSSDQINITDNLGNTVYTMTYYDTFPWPKGCDGCGRTLELDSTTKNPNLPQSWFDGCMGGSPGVAYRPCNEPIVYSEINYNSKVTLNSGNWVELHNRTSKNIDISGWHFMGDTITKDFKIPAKTILPANGYLVILTDTFVFKQVFPKVKNYVGQAGFSFSNKKDKLRLFDSKYILKYCVLYRDSTPWPLKADGLGYTLELLADTGKADEGSNWFAGCYGGSPGAVYDPKCGTNTLDYLVSREGNIKVMYNSSDKSINVYSESELNATTFQLYDMNGRLIDETKISLPAATNIKVSTNLLKGVYLLRTTENENTFSTKVIVW